MIINRKTNLIKNSQPNDYWKEANQKVHSLVAEILNQKMPLNLKSLDLEPDEDYHNLLAGYQRQYEENLPESDLVASEITYEYLLMVVKSVIKTLKNFVCHSSEYLEGLSDA